MLLPAGVIECLAIHQFAMLPTAAHIIAEVNKGIKDPDGFLLLHSAHSMRLLDRLPAYEGCSAVAAVWSTGVVNKPPPRELLCCYCFKQHSTRGHVIIWSIEVVKKTPALESCCTAATIAHDIVVLDTGQDTS